MALHKRRKQVLSITMGEYVYCAKCARICSRSTLFWMRVVILASWQLSFNTDQITSLSSMRERHRNYVIFAPYLVALPPESSVMETLIDIGWGQNWGLYLTSTANGPELHGALRRLLIAYLPDKHQVLLRFYDPRVFEGIFAEPSEQQCMAFFSHVNSYLMNGRLPQMATGFIRAGLGLDRVDIQLSEHSTLTRTSIEMTTSARSHDREVTLSANQVSNLKAQERGAWMDHLVQVIRHEHPQQGLPKDEKELRELVLYGSKQSQRYGIRSDKDVADYLSLMIELGPNLDQDTRLPWVSKLLHGRMAPHEKLSRLKERAYLERSSKNIERNMLP